MKLMLFGLLAMLSVPAMADASDRNAMTLASLERMFGTMRVETKWNLDGPLLWGYFFADPDPKKLQPVADLLARSGYRFVDIYSTDDGTTFFLHVEKIERHTPETLNKRNQEFYQLAEKFHLASYDGMDVGPAD